MPVTFWLDDDGRLQQRNGESFGSLIVDAHRNHGWSSSDGGVTKEHNTHRCIRCLSRAKLMRRFGVRLADNLSVVE